MATGTGLWPFICTYSKRSALGQIRINNLEATMQSVHEILTEWDVGTEHTALQALINDLFPVRQQTNIIILDEQARHRALQKKLERQHLRNASVRTAGFGIV